MNVSGYEYSAGLWLETIEKYPESTMFGVHGDNDCLVCCRGGQYLILPSDYDDDSVMAIVTREEALAAFVRLIASVKEEDGEGEAGGRPYSPYWDAPKDTREWAGLTAPDGEL